MDKVLSIEVHDKTVRGPNEKWAVKEGDWRDPDEVHELKGFGVMTNDQGKLVFQIPDLGRHLDPLELLKRAEKDGLRVYGFIVLRDEQRHN